MTTNEMIELLISAEENLERQNHYVTNSSEYVKCHDDAITSIELVRLELERMKANALV